VPNYWWLCSKVLKNYYELLFGFKYVHLATIVNVKVLFCKVLYVPYISTFFENFKLLQFMVLLSLNSMRSLHFTNDFFLIKKKISSKCKNFNWLICFKSWSPKEGISFCKRWLTNCHLSKNLWILFFVSGSQDGKIKVVTECLLTTVDNIIFWKIFRLPKFFR
jgi:hypothetical protein